ncbi:g-protein coupled receptor protein [Ceratocystis lukuohia]|uniref:Ribonucleases G and E n=2 Tax=Ceratocystis TaxID=5157 RepID=A0A0F8B3B5_CERFI|nr:Ribonucleases G and E [Ceratocystis platani]
MTMPQSFTPVYPSQATGQPPAQDPTGQHYYQSPPQQAQQAMAAPGPAAAPAYAAKSPALIIDTPAWVVAVFSVIMGLTLPILGLSARIIHDLYLDCNGLSLAISIMTWLAVGYVVLTEKMPALRGYYHIYLVIAVNLFMTLMWLVTMAAVAHKRAQFKYPVTLGDCSSDGSLLNSTTCSILKRWYVQVLTKTGLAMEVAIACLSALQMILYLVVSIWFLKTYFDSRNTVATTMVTGPSAVEAQQYVPAPQQPEKQDAVAAAAPPPVYNTPVAAPLPVPSVPVAPAMDQQQHAAADPVSPLAPPMSSVSPVSSSAVMYSPTPPPPMAVPSDVSELPSHAQQQMNPPVEMYAAHTQGLSHGHN